MFATELSPRPLGCHPHCHGAVREGGGLSPEAREDVLSKNRNGLLEALSAEDFALLSPHLEEVQLPRREYLERRGRQVEHVYFPDTGVASVIAAGGAARTIEIGLIGREGMSGLSATLGRGRASYDILMQVAGFGRRVLADIVRSAMDESAVLRRCLLSYAHAFSVQIGATTLSKAHSKLEERLSRWLLMVHDRVDGDEIRVTHATLASLLGARRVGVTIVLGRLEERRLVEMKRGAVIILDRDALERCANGAYGMAESEMRRLQC